MKLILLSAVLAGAGWAAKTEIEQRYENFPPCSRPSNEPSEDASCTTATTDPDNWFMKGQDTMAAAYKDLAEMKAKVKKPKPLKVRWIEVVTRDKCVVRGESIECQNVPPLELGLREDGVVVWR